MKQLLILSLVVLSLTACGNRNSKKTAEEISSKMTLQVDNPATVYVYYFHGKQRCRAMDRAINFFGIIINWCLSSPLPIS